MKISRRNFIKGSVATVAGGAAIAGLSGCTSDDRTKIYDKNISKTTVDGRSVGSKGNGNYQIINAEDIEGGKTGTAEV